MAEVQICHNFIHLACSHLSQLQPNSHQKTALVHQTLDFHSLWVLTTKFWCISLLTSSLLVIFTTNLNVFPYPGLTCETLLSYGC